MQIVDKKEQLLHEQFETLGDIGDATVRKSLRDARRRIKRQLHRYQRHIGKAQVRTLLTISEESE